MIAQRNRLAPANPLPVLTQTEAHQVWQQLATTQQEQILQRLVQICRMLAKQAPKTREVQHEPLT